MKQYPHYCGHIERYTIVLLAARLRIITNAQRVTIRHNIAMYLNAMAV
jgi:hypothetical protein